MLARLLRLCSICLFLAHPAMAQAEALRVLALDLAKPGLDQVLPGFEQTYHVQVALEVAPLEKLMARLQGGAKADVVILDAANLERFEARKHLRALEVAELGRLGLAVAVKAGAPIPAILTEEEAKASFSASRSLAYAEAKSGSPSASRLFTALAKLGLENKLASTLRPLASPMDVARAVATGEVDLGVGMASEFANQPGIALAGFLPHSLQRWIILRAARLSDSEPARAFIDYIADDDNLRLFAKGGYR